MNDLKDLIDSEIPTLVDFFATWCGPCKAMHPILEQLKQRVGDSAHIVKIDVDAPGNQPMAHAYQIRNIPTLILFKNGKVVWKNVGSTDLQTLVSAIENA